MNLFKPINLRSSSVYHYGNVSFFRFFEMDTFKSESFDARSSPMRHIVGYPSPWEVPEFPIVSPSPNHTVLYHVPSRSNSNLGEDRPPKPWRGSDKWDHEHVRLPCSSKSFYPVEVENEEPILRKRWDMVTEALLQPIRNCKELVDAILSYNSKFKDTWKFTALYAFFDEYLDKEASQQFFNLTLPFIQNLALDLPKLVQAPIPLLKKRQSRAVSMTQQQVSSLLANAFFCTFPRRNTNKRGSEYASYPHINFSELYECAGYADVLEKLKCFCHYFKRVCPRVPVGTITFQRRYVPEKDFPDWQNSCVPLAATPLLVDPDGRIEKADGLIQVDFANKYLGGGVLGHGSVQEEIRFAACPELIVGMLIAECMSDNEAIFIIGGERYSEYKGYSRSFRWAGDYRDNTPRDGSGRRRVAVLAIDALPFTDGAEQFRRVPLLRDLNKAWIGMSMLSADDWLLQYPGVATGNWGCGAFGGEPRLKSLLQLMASAQARRPLAYYTFHDLPLRDYILDMYSMLTRNNCTVGQLFKYIMQFSENQAPNAADLLKFIRQQILDKALKSPQIVPVAPSNVKNNLERMDTTSPSNTTNDASDSLSVIPLGHSPDLFSQEDKSQLNQNVASKKPKRSLSSHEFETTQELDEDNEILDSIATLSESNVEYFEIRNTMAVGDDSADLKNSRLCDEIQKLEDEEMMNSSAAHTTPVAQRKNILHDAGQEMDKSVKTPKVQSKVTDFFRKK